MNEPIDAEAVRAGIVTLGNLSVRVVESGDPRGDPVLFLHGWPQTSYTWRHVMGLARHKVRAIAIDLPGVGGSSGQTIDGTTRQLALVVEHLIDRLGLERTTVVGQDLGGMVAYACLRGFPGRLRGVVVMDVAVPGVDPWDRVLGNPYIWHFRLHAVPDFPERLVQGKQREYFDYFFDVLSPHPERLTEEARDNYAAGYATDAALTAGFNWYRAFPRDAADNIDAAGVGSVDTPLLYLRGEQEGGDIQDYVDGFRAAGLSDVTSALVPDAGHFTQEENPAEVWRLISEFISR